MTRMLSFLVLLVLLAGCSTKTNKVVWSPEISEQVISGGWVNGSTDSPSAIRAAKFLAAEVAKTHMGGDFERLLGVNTQVVAGTNYSLSILLTDGSVWGAVIYENLEGVYAVTSMERVK